MKESSIIKLAMRATNRNKEKKGVVIHDSIEFGICRYINTHGGTFRVMPCDFSNKLIAEQVPFVGY